ncbi:MAG: MBL fold metallo-hydrolase [Syntrophobacteraceae bacterium]|jgi:glyoxylase-like metal-dependent hydrolase (beta-lactamase superfamily II)
MVEELLPNLYLIRIPLPGSPLGWVNSYVIKGRDRNLVVDTGLNRRECLEAMQAGLGEIEVDLKKTDFYITHMHADHIGLAPRLAEDTSTIYINRPDKEYMENWVGWEAITGFARLNGFPAKELQAAVGNHPAYKYGMDVIPEASAVDEGDTFRYGGYCFRALATPGHTRGHTCLYEPEKKVLVSGDHILFDISPNITCWSQEENPLKNYIASLDKIYGLQVDLVLPGHRRFLGNCRSRITELKVHHQSRLQEALSILKQGPKNAYEVASMMTWDIDCDSWEAFPASQKYFATAEAVAHLRYLEDSGQVFREKKAGGIVFSTCHG